MCGPGSKVSQTAAMMHNEGRLICVETIPNRYYKLRAVARLLGAENIDFILKDGRRFRPREDLFDKILVDAPCSTEGRFHTANKKSWRFWSGRKIKEMVRKQKGLLLTASRLLTPGGILVYATCTFAPEENETVIDWLLRKTEGTLNIIPVPLPADIGVYPALREWKGKTFHDQIRSLKICLSLS